MLDLIFWLVMAGVFMLGWPEWVIWWRVYQWKRQMKRDFYAEQDHSSGNPGQGKAPGRYED